MKPYVKYLKIIFNLLLALCTVLLCIYALPKVFVFFLPFIIGWFISMIANPLVRFLERKFKIVRKAGSVFVIVLVLGCIIFAGYLVTVKIAEQTIAFIQEIPNAWKSVESDLITVGDKLSAYYEKLPAEIKIGIEDLRVQSSDYFGDSFKNMGEPTVEAVGNFAKNIPLALISIIMTVISSYFFIAEREMVIEFVKKNTSETVKARWNLIQSSLKQAVGGYFVAQFKIMGIVAIILFAGFGILQIKYAILLGILISMLDFLPFFGTGTVMVPWAVIKVLTGEYRMAIGLVIIWGVSQLVRQIIQPKIVGDSMGMPPLPTLFLLYAGFRFAGALGLIIAVPIGMIVYNLYKAGVFSNTIKSVKILLRDINEFRKIE